MLVLKNVKSDETIGVLKSIFTLGYDILQYQLNKLDIPCDIAFNLCVLYYNEFYHSEYNKNASEYDEMEEFFINPFFPVVLKNELTNGGVDKFFIKNESQLNVIKKFYNDFKNNKIMNRKTYSICTCIPCIKNNILILHL